MLYIQQHANMTAVLQTPDQYWVIIIMLHNDCWWQTLLVKAAPIVIFILNMDQMTTCKVKAIAHSD